MKDTLVQVLSTGRCGTKFLYSLFKYFGYASYREGLGTENRTQAIIKDMNRLGDIWFRDKDSYFSMETDFAAHYFASVKREFDSLKKIIPIPNSMSCIRTKSPLCFWSPSVQALSTSAPFSIFLV